MDSVISLFPDGIDSLVLEELGLLPPSPESHESVKNKTQHVMQFITDNEIGSPALYYKMTIFSTDENMTGINDKQRSELLLALVEDADNIIERLCAILSLKYETLFRLVLSSRESMVSLINY